MKQIPDAPWKVGPLSEWTIVGMNHYFEGKGYAHSGRFLYVAMTKGDLCIRAEGADEKAVWIDLCVKSILAGLPKCFILSFDPAKSEDPHITSIFSDRYGGLVWCALRHCRLTDQFFNKKIARMLTTLREIEPNPKRWLNSNYDLARELPRSIFGNDEDTDLWAEALHRITSKLQDVWTYKVSANV